ncbi:MAG: hypothetical protein A4E48_00818 [Methanosaeta sp. PtaU1.Bin060]|nr:MAG: hypothetical protein A4E48_00818 [Methanosaeta sp. PtaU1.Bin060]
MLRSAKGLSIQCKLYRNNPHLRVLYAKDHLNLFTNSIQKEIRIVRHEIKADLKTKFFWHSFFDASLFENHPAAVLTKYLFEFTGANPEVVCRNIYSNPKACLPFGAMKLEGMMS